MKKITFYTKDIIAIMANGKKISTRKKLQHCSIHWTGESIGGQGLAIEQNVLDRSDRLEVIDDRVTCVTNGRTEGIILEKIVTKAKLQAPSHHKLLMTRPKRIVGCSVRVYFL